jgi:hypothetical protein
LVTIKSKKRNKRNTVFNKISIAGNMEQTKELKTIYVAQQLLNEPKMSQLKKWITLFA